MDALPRWLTQIPGIEVLSIIPMKAEKNGLYERSFALKIRKSQVHFVIPKTLILRSYTPGTPPERVYDLP
jgi:hypothetical protein